MPSHLDGSGLTITVPEVHKDARFQLSFMRTLRIPDDGNDYALPPGLGSFPLREVASLTAAPDRFAKHGGYIMPMYQSEAMWIAIGGQDYPFALKVAVGRVNAVTGEPLEPGLDGENQDYLAVPAQPWLDGICVTKGTIRQFVAMPLGGGYTVEEQITGSDEFGGLQLIAYPMKAAIYEASVAARRRAFRAVGGMSLSSGMAVLASCSVTMDHTENAGMGLAAGGSMVQEIYRDSHSFTDYDLDHPVVVNINLCNSEAWHALTGEAPPYEPPSAKTYTAYGLPWFNLYSETPALEGSAKLAEVKTVNQILDETGGEPLADNETVPEAVMTPVEAAVIVATLTDNA